MQSQFVQRRLPGSTRSRTLPSKVNRENSGRNAPGPCRESKNIPCRNWSMHFQDQKVTDTMREAMPEQCNYLHVPNVMFDANRDRAMMEELVRRRISVNRAKNAQPNNCQSFEYGSLTHACSVGNAADE